MSYCLEIRSTANWSDVRYRDYTRSAMKADAFKTRVARIDFTDSGHGLIPVVRETERREPKIMVLAEHVRACLRGEA